MRLSSLGWTKTTIRLPDSLCRLDVRSVPSEIDWARIAEDYWAGKLAGAEQVISSTTAIVHRAALPGGTGPHFFKRYLMRNWMARMKSLFRVSRSVGELRGGLQLVAQGFTAPIPVCLIRKRFAWWTLVSVLVTEAITEGENLQEAIQARLGTEARGERRTLMRAAGALVGKLHAAGICHGDLRARNILCRQDRGEWVFSFLDNERTRATRGFRDRARNLVQLNVLPFPGLTDRVRFWQAYVESAGLAAREAESLQREVVRWTQERWGKYGKETFAKYYN